MSSLVTAWCSSFRLIKLTCEYLTQTVAVGNLCQIVKHVKWDRLNISSRLVSPRRSRFTVNTVVFVCWWTDSSCLTLTIKWRRSETSTRCGSKAASPSPNWREGLLTCWHVEVLNRTRLNTSWYQMFGTGTGDKRVFHDLVLYLFLDHETIFKV